MIKILIEKSVINIRICSLQFAAVCGKHLKQCSLYMCLKSLLHDDVDIVVGLNNLHFGI